MTMVDVDNELYQRIKKVVKDHVEFAHIQHFVNLAVKEKLESVKK